MKTETVFMCRIYFLCFFAKGEHKTIVEQTCCITCKDEKMLNMLRRKNRNKKDKIFTVLRNYFAFGFFLIMIIARHKNDQETKNITV